MTERHYDAIVVGAGPAGSTAARGLALAGLRTLILEKERLPRYKTCGGGLSGKVASALGFDFSPVVEQPISRGLVTSETAPPVNYPFDGPAGWCVMRAGFDHFLVEQAVAAGAECQAGTAVRGLSQDADGVRVETDGGGYRASVLVGADGVNGRVARWVGLGAGRRLAVALEAEVDVSQAALEAWRGVLHLHLGGVPWGYAWVFPKAEHLSIGVATFQDRRRIDLRRHLRDFLDGQPLLRGHAIKLLRGQHIPMGGRPGPLHAGRVLLAGDAGGFADPVLGEGIYYAIRSGQLAAQVIAPALAAGGQPDLSQFTRRANAGLHADFARANLFAFGFYRWPALFCWLQSRSPAIQSQIREVLAEDFTYHKAARQTASQMRRIVLELARQRAG